MMCVFFFVKSERVRQEQNVHVCAFSCVCVCHIFLICNTISCAPKRLFCGGSIFSTFYVCMAKGWHRSVQKSTCARTHSAAVGAPKKKKKQKCTKEYVCQDTFCCCWGPQKKKKTGDICIDVYVCLYIVSHVLACYFLMCSIWTTWNPGIIWN